MVARCDMDAEAGQPSLSEAECHDIALDVSLQAYAICNRPGLARSWTGLPFWLKAAT